MNLFDQLVKRNEDLGIPLIQISPNRKISDSDMQMINAKMLLKSEHLPVTAEFTLQEV